MSDPMAEIIRFGKRFNARQQALATAQVYIKRYLTKCEIRRTNVYLLITAALYLASKMEESPIHIKTIVAESIKQWPGTLHARLRTSIFV